MSDYSPIEEKRQTMIFLLLIIFQFDISQKANTNRIYIAWHCDLQVTDEQSFIVNSNIFK
jgi:hypothetical protein